MKIELTQKQAEHVLECLKYCQAKIWNYGNIGMDNWPDKVNSNSINKFEEKLKLKSTKNKYIH